MTCIEVGPACSKFRVANGGVIGPRDSDSLAGKRHHSTFVPYFIQHQGESHQFTLKFWAPIFSSARRQRSSICTKNFKSRFFSSRGYGVAMVNPLPGAWHLPGKANQNRWAEWIISRQKGNNEHRHLGFKSIEGNSWGWSQTPRLRYTCLTSYSTF
jgi:hypothetical protein